MIVYYIESGGNYQVAWRRSQRTATAKARQLRNDGKCAVTVTKYKVPPFTKHLVLALIEGNARDVLKAVETTEFEYNEQFATQYAQAGEKKAG